MNESLRTVIVNGSPGRPSSTRVLLNALRDRLAENVPLDVTHIDLVDVLPELGVAHARESFPPALAAAIASIENADFLIIGAPVFRASFPGLFKHLFDLVNLDAFHGKPVLLAATGGSTRHALVIDLQLRPLFSFFQALTLPVGVYATPEDIQQGQVVSDSLMQRIDLAVEHAEPVLQHRVRARQAGGVPDAFSNGLGLAAKAA